MKGGHLIWKDFPADYRRRCREVLAPLESSSGKHNPPLSGVYLHSKQFLIFRNTRKVSGLRLQKSIFRRLSQV